MTVTLTERQLVTVETIADIRPIPDADAIEAATVRGWTVVVRKGEFTVGDRVLYFEIDSLLPLDDPWFAFLAPRGEKVVDGLCYHRLKTARLRGCYSQGLVLPAAEFDQLGYTDGTLEQLQQRLGVIKYEPPVPTNAGDIIGEFPTHLASKTDSERVQNLAAVWDVILAAGPWIPTEKVDGTSMTVAQDNDGVSVSGRNWRIGDGDNLYWNAARESGLIDVLAENEHIAAIQCEIVGPGVQSDPLRLGKVRVVVFDVIGSKRWPLARGHWPAALLALAAPVYDLPMPATPDEAIAQVDGLKSRINPQRLAEGVVWHHSAGYPLPELGYRSTWKAISNRYLLKNEG